MNSRQESAWKNLSFYRGYLPPSDREKVKEYLLLTLGEESAASAAAGIKRENSTDPPVITLPCSSTPIEAASTPLTDSKGKTSPLVTLGTFKVEGSDALPLRVPPLLPLSVAASAAPAGELPPTPSVSAQPATNKRLEYRRFFIMKKSALAQIPHFKSYLFKVKKCLEICSSPTPCSPECPNVHVDIDENPNLIELTYDPSETLIVNRGNQLPSIHIRLSDMEKTAGSLFCCGLVKHNITQAVQGTQCRFGDKCRYGSRCLFVHMKPQVAADDEFAELLVSADTPISEAVPFLSDKHEFIAHLAEMGITNVGDVQMLSNMAFDALVSRSAAHQYGLWTQVHNLRELRERGVPLPVALTYFHGISPEKIMDFLELQPRIETIAQLLEMKSKAFYALKVPTRILDACERLRTRYEPEREAYSQIDLRKLSDREFLSRAVKEVLQFRHYNAHKSWRKQDATRPIVTSLITFVDPKACFCQAVIVNGATTSATQTPMLGSAIGRHQSSMISTSSPSKAAAGSTQLDEEYDSYPRTSWCHCPRKWELAVNYELSTPSGSRCSEQNCLGKLASMGLPTASIREIFVHGDKHEDKDLNPMFPCGVCENMLRRITHDVQKQYNGGDVTLYMFDQLNPRKLVCLPVQEISHRDGSNFKRFMADIRGDDDDAFGASIN